MAFQINLILLFAHASAVMHKRGFEVMPDGNSTPEDGNSTPEDGNSTPEDSPRGSANASMTPGSDIVHPAVIITGICDSGTRGVTDALMNLGLKVCKKTLHPHTLDSDLTNPFTKIHKILASSEGLHFKKQEKADLFEEAVTFEREAAKKTRQCIDEESGTSTGLWGYKNPDHIFLLPVLDKAFNHTAKYLIVARDPRDVCTAENQIQYNTWGKQVLQGQTDDCYQFWAMTWKEVLDNYGSSNAVKVVRIEDLVMPDPSRSTISKKTLRRTLRFIGISPKPRRIKAKLKQMHKFAGEYMVHHYDMTDEDRQKLLLQVSSRPQTDNDLLFDIMGQLGYNTSKINLTTPKAGMVINANTRKHTVW